MGSCGRESVYEKKSGVGGEGMNGFMWKGKCSREEEWGRWGGDEWVHVEGKVYTSRRVG